MAFPGAKLVQRVFRSNFRFSLYSKTIRSVSVVENKALLHNCATKQVSNTVLQVPLNFIQRSQVRAMGSLSPLDPSSYSRPELAVVRHVSLSLNVDFENKVLNGTAVLSFEVLEDINELILDVSNLTIESIQLDDDTALEFTIDGLIPNFGSKLTIKLPKQVSASEKKVGTDNVQKNEKEKEICPGFMKKTAMSLTFTGFEYRPVMQDAITETEIKFDVEEVTSLDSHDSCKCVSEAQAPKEKRPSQNNVVIDNPVESLDNDERFKIKIKYSTAPTASALQWLEPSQTSGKKYPYMFSQCQPIHARSIMPCQDTPAVKFTYDAEVSAPEEFTVLMSAIKGETRNAKATFKQPIPIPSYLLALAVGVLESRPLGPRSKVWSEKEEVEKSAWEFAETEKYLQAAERLCGPYQWTQYDLLVLPPSFPYGGMENPCLTFVTPTLLAGDRSQADVIVHEIMHSWTGNLITNVNFEHFWLNEGFTVFLERKVGASLIADPVEAKKSRDFHSLLGLQELSEAVNEQFGPTDPLTRLVPDLHGIHPDDAFSRVPYEKGSLFLRYLEDLVGGPEVFDDFLRSYLNHFQKKSLNTDQFKEYLLNYFKEGGKLADVDWDSWFYKSGMPPVIPAYDTSMTKDITSLLAKIEEPNATLAYEDVKTFTPHQMINLLQELIDRPALPLDQLRALGEEYKVAQNKNTEILYRWLRLCVRSRDSEKIPDVFDFVNSQGRMKYVRPLYRDLYAWEDVRDQAIDNFLKNEPNMMHVSAYTVRKDLHLN